MKRAHVSSKRARSPRPPKRAKRSSSGSRQKEKKEKEEEERLRCPILEHRAQLLATIAECDLTLVIGAPGQGKSTQLPRMLLEAGLHGAGQVAVVHVNAAAAIAAAQAAAQRLKGPAGGLVGFQTRFEVRYRPGRTRLKFLTDGCLMREMLDDPLLRAYSIVLLDDVHQRRWQTDVLLRFLRKMVHRRKQLRKEPPKLILMGSLMDTSDLLAYFSMLQSRVVFLSNSNAPEHELKCKDLQTELQVDHVVTAVRSVVLLHKNYREGDILCFLGSRSEVFNACFLTRCLLASSNAAAASLRPFVMSLYEGMPLKELKKVVSAAPEGHRKVIFSDSFAENSMKIHGVRIVVDSGFCQVRDFLDLPPVPALGLERISSAQAWYREQRARAHGRGMLYRLYTRPDPSAASAIFPAPELERVSLAPAVLFSLKLNCNARSFPWPCQLFENQFTAAIHQLMQLGAITERGEPSQLKLTRIGELMLRLPLDVPLARALVAAAELGCSAELLTIAAMLNAGPIFHDFGRSPEQFQRARRHFATAHGDCVSLLLIYRGYRAAVARSQKFFCRRRCLNATSLRLAFRIRRQLRAIFLRLGLPVRSCGADLTRVNAALTAGYVFCLARHIRVVANGSVHHAYRSVFTGQQLTLSPDSALFANATPQFLVHLGLEEVAGGGREIRRACPAGIAFARELFPDLISESGEALDGSS